MLIVTSSASGGQQTGRPDAGGHQMRAERVGRVFVVGTGRCGSTLLSNAFRAHDQLLSLSELFASLFPFGFDASQPVSREQFVRLLSRPRAEASLLLKFEAEPAEYLYDVDGSGRYDRLTGIPPIAVTAIPHLTDSVDAFLDQLIERLPWRVVPVGEAFECLFSTIAAERGATTWVERSGSSLLYVDRLIRMFPGARLVHIYRSGPACAASMAGHPVFRLAYLKYLVALRDGAGGRTGAWDVQRAWPDAVALEEAIASALDEPVGYELLRLRRLPMEWFGLLWSLIVTRGLRNLARVDPADILHVSYERLVEQPAVCLGRIMDFVGVATRDAWIDEQAARIGRRESPIDGLSDIERRQLDRACALGQEALAGIAGAP